MLDSKPTHKNHTVFERLITNGLTHFQPRGFDTGELKIHAVHTLAWYSRVDSGVESLDLRACCGVTAHLNSKMRKLPGYPVTLNQTLTAELVDMFCQRCLHIHVHNIHYDFRRFNGTRAKSAKNGGFNG